MANMIGALPDPYTISVNENDKLRRQLIEAQEEIQRLNHIINNYKQELNVAQMKQRKK